MMIRALIALAVSLSTFGCAETTSTHGEDAPKHAGPNQAVMDKDIANAVQSAQATPTQPGAGQPGPPPSGVFAPGEADKVVPAGMPVKIDLIDGGSGAKMVLTPSLDLPKGGTLRVSIARSIPGGALPTTVFELSVKTPGADAEDAEGSIVFVVDKVTVDTGQQGAPPADVAKMLASLKGTKVAAKLSQDGSVSGEKLELAKGVKPPLDQFVVGLVDVLGLFFSPFPSEPVGVGAYWIAADRTKYAGMDLARYRVTKVEKMVGDELVLSSDVRMYAADANQMPAIAQGEAMLVGFATSGKGALAMRRGTLLPITAELKLPVLMKLASPQQPQRVVPLQFETTGQVLAPTKSDAAD